ncbi:hypothetical protein [Paractinoplanes ferrugineus]|nr:hypothetical protein [Actinoplanes ferrugineus]
MTPWTANETAQWTAPARTGVTGLITDRLGEFIGWLDGR